MSTAVEAFASAVDPAIAVAVRGSPTAADVIAAQIKAGPAAWPELAVPEAEFARHLATRVDPDRWLESLHELRAADLYLALACARGDVAAITAFEHQLFREVEIAGAAARAGSDLVDETKAHLRHVLFVGRDDRPPATADYAGRGDLRGWVRVSALRHMLRVQGRAKRELHLDDQSLLDALSPAHDPELDYIRAMYRDAFAAAFRDAVATLDQRQKSLLRYQLVDGLTIDDIASLHGVHRATASRWLASARDAIADGTRALLAKRLDLKTEEIESLIRLVRSRVDVSLERLIQEDGPT
jgi:RNA polymerase sigma-70 factor (ECF subfamily)